MLLGGMVNFFKVRPEGFSNRRIEDLGKALRDGGDYDEELLERFLEHQSFMCDEITEVALTTVNSLILSPIPSTTGLVEPNSGQYFLTARVKTISTLVEKLRRMEIFPLNRIMDVSGVRFDCDLGLSEQSKIVEIFRNDLLNAGVGRVDLRDLRNSPHSGYRAIHLHLITKAGRAEFQFRTALQAQWANVYEVAADVYGRQIRYLEHGVQLGDMAKETVQKLHELSDQIYSLERKFDLPETKLADSSQVEFQKIEIYDKLKQMKDELSGLREH